MSSPKTVGPGIASVLGRWALAGALTALAAVMMLYLAGRFEEKVGQARPGPHAPASRPVEGRLEPARVVRQPAIESAVGTVRPVYESQVAAKIMARVLEVNLRAGQPIKRGQVLVKLDDADLLARRQQAQAVLAGAQATRDQTALEVRRVEKLHEVNAATQLELDRQRTAFKTAEARVHQAEQSVREAQTLMEYATVVSPIDGTVIDKRVNVGDIATPGQVLATMYDPTRMQLIASVRESLAQRLRPGQNIDVWIDAMGQTCTGTVSEIVPEAEAASRAFSVKVTGPCHPGVYAGMFGRLLIPLDEEELLVVPRGAVRRVGQLDMVEVAEGEGEAATLRRRAVTLGRPVEGGSMIEVLSGLSPGERVVVEPTNTPLDAPTPGPAHSLTPATRPTSAPAPASTASPTSSSVPAASDASASASTAEVRRHG